MYTPPQKILDNYADVLVHFALHGGTGVKRNEVVQVNIPDVAKPLYIPIQNAILRAGGHPKMQLLATDVTKDYFKHAKKHQLTFFPEKYKKAEAELLDHSISIIAETDMKELADVDPKAMFMAMDARRKFRDWLFDKEAQEQFTWTLALYGTEAMAKEAGMSLKEYWQQIIHACFLDAKDPIKEWKRIQKEQDRIKHALTTMQIDRVHVKGKDVDLWVKIGEKRQWLGGSGRNIPSFELFVSPDWRGTEGTIRFNQPLYRYGNILKDVSLEFKKGKVAKAHAKTGNNVLQQMIKRKNADKVGEFSLTDKRFSRITKFMANTLYDENTGGKFGNTHIAVGKAYRESYTGSLKTVTKKQLDALGFNDSPEHTDIISTTDRTVTAYLPDGSEKVIFENGSFTV